MGTIILIIAALILCVLLYDSFFTVRQQTIGSVERFGRFVRTASTGLNFKIPLIEKVAKVIDLRIQQMVVEVETKTKDNVFVRMHIAVQYYVLENNIIDAFYRLSNPVSQIQSHVLDIVRGQVPKMELDLVFENKDIIALTVKNDLSHSMNQFGYEIQTTLITEIDPDKKVKLAMNDINAAQRERIAANERGEAERILAVKKAEGEAQSKELQGKGIANQRRAIIDGLQQSVELFQKAIAGSSADDVMKLVIMIQYLDTLKEIGTLGKSNTVFLPHSPGSLSELMNQISSAIMAANSCEAGPKEG
ncbi:MAG: SPFH domain-containing protein [Myxococcales bacterium]|nr:SPFH domain-containing protein [Myxococcales bacterium]USN49965.1 MAG: SPFH domain-containing protein [Myxococcales bacterium]